MYYEQPANFPPRLNLTSKTIPPATDHNHPVHKSRYTCRVKKAVQRRRDAQTTRENLEGRLWDAD